MRRHAADVIYDSHTYAEAGPYAVNVTLTDAGGYTAEAASTANIADAALTAGAVSVTGVTEGQSYSGPVATFSDANLNARPPISPPPSTGAPATVRPARSSAETAASPSAVGRATTGPAPSPSS